MKQILCFGDSNTYGYDPADYYSFSYPEDERWTSIAGKLLGDGYKLINEGLNGRMIPDMRYHSEYVDGMARELKEGDLFAIMLGTNDLPMRNRPDASVPVRKMKEFLKHITPKAKDNLFSVLVIAPVPIGKGLDGVGEYHEQSLKMNIGFEDLAKEYGVLYSDAGNWHVELAFDHVHFSSKGHRAFAEGFADYLASSLFCNDIS